MEIVGAVLNLSHCRVVFPQYWNSVVGAVGSNYWKLWFAASNPKPSEIAQERRSQRRWIHCPPLVLEATGDPLKCEIWTAASLDCRLNYHICLRSIKINPILNYVMRSADTNKQSIQLPLLHTRLRSFASHCQNKQIKWNLRFQSLYSGPNIELFTNVRPITIHSPSLISFQNRLKNYRDEVKKSPSFYNKIIRY